MGLFGFFIRKRTPQKVASKLRQLNEEEDVRLKLIYEDLGSETQDFHDLLAAIGRLKISAASLHTHVTQRTCLDDMRSTISQIRKYTLPRISKKNLDIEYLISSITHQLKCQERLLNMMETAHKPEY